MHVSSEGQISAIVNILHFLWFYTTLSILVGFITDGNQLAGGVVNGRSTGSSVNNCHKITHCTRPPACPQG